MGRNGKIPIEEKVSSIEKYLNAINEFFDAALLAGRTLSGEHGISITKRPHIAKALGEAGIYAENGQDPKGLLNPRKIW
ncbi:MULTISPECIES: FAD-linked oxidase C-terminal domain-containing protein [Pelosinus]|jgi:glycolate oxidase|uniref:FAD linked oxidase domain protein n=1 Tax=Pelosinus fermentans B4 TaxID=1149862 RepID=I9L5T2_9FIRM|nr:MULTISPECIES: FAD-linked oxidase C-terminal domain-containing protein [Pelosinus]EIW15581.1 FAD linked oxidase domain protein [Pelosinus fermentans B4]EIW26729.1 D-lactate/glycolate dehydrogenase FAD-binding protein [Pelosinus fermentans A11]OAM92326.1 FAD linked oxidase domain protein [Pelosinus fermentans DSM 17108]SDQ40963.1 FAD linked oxidases, C-terminal domain [Pelosinus fermentans]